jgi:putative ABC transport system substrate-binding protein
MRRREFIGFVGGLAAWPLTARAQQSKMPVIGYLSELPVGVNGNAAFQRGMAELGYVEGKNFAIEYRAKPESLPQAAADLVRRNVNAISRQRRGRLPPSSKPPPAFLWWP